VENVLFSTESEKEKLEKPGIGEKQRLCLVLSTNLALYKFLIVFVFVCNCKYVTPPQSHRCGGKWVLF